MTRNWVETLVGGVKAQTAWGLLALVMTIVMYLQNNLFMVAWFAFLSAWGLRGALEDSITRLKQEEAKRK